MPSYLPEDADERNGIPLADGLFFYFPHALRDVAKVSKHGNDQHNPGQPMHWARWKSTDHENKILRHLLDAGRKDSHGIRHTARLAWRALAMLQIEIERDENAPLPRNARTAPITLPDGIVAHDMATRLLAAQVQLVDED